MTNVNRLNVGGREIILVGTAHISKKSVELVRETINAEKPDVVAIELCGRRNEAIKNKERWDETEIHQVIKTGGSYMLLMQLFLGNLQRKLGDEIGVKPGAEMLEAINAANDAGIPVALVDRDIAVTLKRAFALMPLREKLHLAYDLVLGIFEREEINEDLIEKLKEKDMLTEIMEDLAKEVPSVKRVLIDERDEYIAKKIVAINARKIVAVVGAGHVQGIINRINAAASGWHTAEMHALESVPVGKSRLMYLGYAITLIFTCMVAWGFYQHGSDIAVEMLVKWFLIHGTLSALGVLIAFGHPFSAAAAFVAAPFTSLHPILAAGWFAGAVEAWVRKPRVMDFEGLMKLNSFADYRKNRVTRIFLVMTFANIGSSIGTFIALPYLATIV